MKKTVLALALILSLIPLPTVSVDSSYILTDVIVELVPPEDGDYHSYAKDRAEYAAKLIRDLECDAIYDTLLCGFSAKIPEHSVALLEKCDFVESVYYSASYEPMSYGYSDSASAMLASEMVGINAAKSAGLTGDGIKVAVIDSGFDVTHPAFDKEVTETLDLESFAERLALNKLNAQKTVEDLSKLRHNSKIPFMFDYANKDTDVSTTLDHGTHVAGIIGAAPTDKSTMQGIAPDCQLLLMKVFGDDGSSALDSVLISALEDALKLGADVINMSIGHYAGSSQTSRIIGLDNLLRRIEEKGCTVICAAGNDSFTTDRSTAAVSDGIFYPPAGYTDYGAISSPSASEHALAVAAVNNDVYYGEYIRHGENQGFFFEYTDTNVTGEVIPVTFREYFHGKTLDYAVIPGIGEEKDYEGIDVKGKLALVIRGTIPFAEKANIAAANGALGVIVYNNIENEYVNMELSGASIPAIFISNADGQRLISESSHRVIIENASISKPHPEGAGTMSRYSSRGTTPSLKLKPDIAGVGGSVYSTLPGGRYGGISGTSMASPQLAGLCALLYEKAKADGSFSAETAVSDAKKVLMNTAIPVRSDDGIEYSPREQGAGLVNFEAALSHSLEITCPENGAPKLELGDRLSEITEFGVKLRNITDSALTFKLGVTLTSDGYTELTLNDKTEYYSTLKPVADTASRITSEASGNLNRYASDYAPCEITLEAGEERIIPMKIEFDNEYHSKLNEIFVNGHFVEGFIYCTSEKINASLPYMGYIGDFSSGSVIDGDIYKEETVIFKGSRLYIPLDDIHITAGANIYTTPHTYDADTISFSPNGDGNADEILFGTSYLRNYLSACMTVTDKDGNILARTPQGYGTKTKGIDETIVFRFFWDGGDGIYDGYTMPDGKYTMTLDFVLDDGRDTKQTYSYDITLDNTYPTLESITLVGDTLTVQASDTNGIFGVRVYEGMIEDAFSKISIDSCAEFDISDYDGSKLYYDIVDYAFNTTVGIIDLNELRNNGD